MSEKIKFTELIKSQEDIVRLGKIDQKDFNDLYNNFSKIALDNPIFKKSMELTAHWQQNKIKKIDSSQELIKNYAKGLNVSESQLYASLLIPEMVSSFNKWIPNLLGFVPGCSSLFTRDEESQGIIHSRILDYSVGVLLSDSERGVHIKNENHYDVFGYTSAGFPIPSLSSINEKGLSLAIHYKHGNFFDIEGSSIFEICYDILLNCKNIKEAKARFKTHKSISHWGVYLSDQGNRVASIDIRGKEINFESFHIDDYEYLYFNNKIMSHDQSVENSQPFGHLGQCSMRRKSLDQNFKDLKPKNLSDSLKTLTRIKNKSKEYALSPLTICSVQAYAINNRTFESEYIFEKAPKFYEQSTLKTKNLFEEKFVLDVNEKKNIPFNKGFRHLAKSQYFIDLKDYENAYFHLQMATRLLKGHPEEFIADFYFNVLEFITISTKEDLYYLVKRFQELRAKLPEYLGDHCKLFEFRILKVLNEKYQIESFEQEIKNKHLRLILKREHQLKVFSLKMLKKLIYPRIELLDIIYAYS